MNNNLGYACINVTLGDQGKFRTTTIKSLKKLCVEEQVKKVKELTLQNLRNTRDIIKWNIQNNISVYRLSSSIIPRATYIEEYWDWSVDSDVKVLCDQIKMLISISGIRVSFHPDQVVTLTNFNNHEVFEKTSYPILAYHNTLANMLGVDTILIHCGGKYNSVDSAMNQFVDNFYKLPSDMRSKIKLENDKIYNLEETLTLANRINVPVVADIHHARCYPSTHDTKYYMDDIKATWIKHGKPKVHLSSGKTCDTDYAHADYITVEDYSMCLDIIGDDIDIVLEAKAKELAILALNL